MFQINTLTYEQLIEHFEMQFDIIRNAIQISFLLKKTNTDKNAIVIIGLLEFMKNSSEFLKMATGYDEFSTIEQLIDNCIKYLPFKTKEDK